MRTLQDEIDEVSELPAYYDKFTNGIKVVPTHAAERWIKNSIHGELQKLTHIMGREFGDRVEDFLKLYIEKVKTVGE